MLVMRERGDGWRVTKRRRMRDRDLLDDRDLLMLAASLQGRPNREIGRIFRITRQLVGRRINDLPDSVHLGMRRLIDRKLAQDGAVLLTEDELAALKAILRRERKRARKAQPVG
jgi:hypothetical protein